MNAVDGDIQLKQILFKQAMIMASVFQEDSDLFERHQFTQAVHESSEALSGLVKHKSWTALKMVMALKQRAREQTGHMPKLADIDAHIEGFMREQGDNIRGCISSLPSHRAHPRLCGERMTGLGERGQEPRMRPAQMHPKDQPGLPQRFLKDRNAFPTCRTRVEFHIDGKVLQLPLLRVAGSEYLSHRTYYLISGRISRCWMHRWNARGRSPTRLACDGGSACARAALASAVCPRLHWTQAWGSRPFTYHGFAGAHVSMVRHLWQCWQRGVPRRTAPGGGSH